MEFKIGKYTVISESLNSLIYLANLLIELVEKGIELADELIPDDCTVEKKDEVKK